MRKFRIKNFEKFQHYKDRRPPWIKLYADVLEDYEFACLQDASKLHLVLIWLLASRHENALPWDAEWIARRINATDPVDLNALYDAGFIAPIQEDSALEQNASAALADCKQDATPENRGQKDSVSIETAKPPPAENEELKKWAFNEGMAWIAENDKVQPESCRSLIGKYCRDFGNLEVAQAIAGMWSEARGSPGHFAHARSMLIKRLKNGQNHETESVDLERLTAELSQRRSAAN